MASNTEKALRMLKYLPRMSLDNLARSPYLPRKNNFRRLPSRIRYPNKSNEERQRWHPLGYEPRRTPWYLKVPAEKYYKNFDARRQYPPFSLRQLQMLVDVNLLDTNEPIDLATLCNRNHLDMIPSDNHFGVHLTDEGIDDFSACVNIEVQYAREPVIAAIERNGGTITTSFFDLKSVAALSNPYKFFLRGEPIPRRQYPTPDAIDYYTNPKNRGYLADPEKIKKERSLLAQKYGYEPPKIQDPVKLKMLEIRKHPRQIFYGLEPGWVVSLSDKEILEPEDEQLKSYYKS